MDELRIQLPDLVSNIFIFLDFIKLVFILISSVAPFVGTSVSDWLEPVRAVDL